MENISNTKFKALAIIFALFGTLALCLLVFLGTNFESALKTLENAHVVIFDDTLTVGMEISGCASECFYSTKVDKSVQDDFKILKVEGDCLKYFNKYWDIRQTYPTNWGESIYPGRYTDDCVAVVISAMSLQDPSKYILANGIYIDNENNAIIELVQIDRDANYGYSEDPIMACEQMYTVVYLSRELASRLNSLTFAINNASQSHYDDCV